jgi:hypothetical protein
VRPTIVTAPDALVYINGETDMLGCQKCRRRLDWNKYITSIQVDLNIDSAGGGSASISMSVPRHAVDEFYYDGNPLISPMMEIEIFAKGYYLVEGIPQYYPIFWGLINEVSDDYSGGEHTFSINCSDILKWWELCKMNINPAFVGSGKTQEGRSIFGNVFFGTNPYDVIWTLAQQAFGDIVIGSGSLTSLVKESSQRQTFLTANADLMAYWTQRFSRLRSNLLLYGPQGNAVRGDTLSTAYSNSRNVAKKGLASQMVRNANGGNSGSQMVFDPTDPSVVAFRTQFQQAGQVNFWQSEYQSKLELANAAKEAIGYEFFMDVTGDIVFKPPFYNLDVLSNKPVSWIQDIDVIDWNFSESEAEVVTQLTLQGAFGGNVDYGMSEEVTPFTSVTDYHLLRKYGWRSQTFNSEFLGSPQLMFYMGLDKLDRINSKRFRGTVNIPLRPELRLGFPIYIAPKDQVWYVNGISHNISFGSRAQTSLSLTAKRNKFVAPKGIGSITLMPSGSKGAKNQKPTAGGIKETRLSARQLSTGAHFKAKIGDAGELPPIDLPDKPGGDSPYEPLILRHPKTGRTVGYPNVVMAYTRPFVKADMTSKVTGNKDPKSKRPVPQNPVLKSVQSQNRQIQADQDAAFHTRQKEDDIREKHLANRYSYGLNSAGVYVYLHDESQAIKEILLFPASHVDFGKNFLSGKNPQRTGMIRPVSDERGFEVIGHYSYGRGLSLQDGLLVRNDTSSDPKATNSRAQVSTQIALTGGMFEMLQAQSQGLGTVKTLYPNPATAVSVLQPEDLQTAATWNPDTKEAKFVNTGPTFVDSAPLGSIEQKGAAPSIEASQLSRALTLAEMSVRTDNSGVEDDNCGCILGRSDLAFISVGYQVSVLRQTTEDKNTFGTGAASSAALTALQQTAAQGHSVPLDAAGSTLLVDALNKNAPVMGSAISVGRTTLISRVETYLTTLYEALDVSHQEYEAALRGETLEVQNGGAIDPVNVRFPAPLTPSKFAPPFSVPGRAVGGDPQAIAQEGRTAVDAMSKTWETFGDKLRSNTQRANLQGQINNEKSAVYRLQNERVQLQKAKDAGNIVTGPGGSVDTQLERNAQALSDTQKDLLNNQQKLNDLNQKFPP